ncbi:uncharacterized protein LOC131628790 [Vicia villosa]|uniref:uncharacterized protein LOC131628790 n=1 Tax=Vicia villosa TaxID=3911 RepID=UPI00273C7E4D|nr:uncharacterized protein LOC131628790 [Vicia villosa]
MKEKPLRLAENPNVKVVQPTTSKVTEIETPQKLWVDVISNNRNPSNGMQIEFIAPQLVNGEVEVTIEEEDIMSEVRYWESALIMYVIGSDLSMHTVKQFMEKNWNFVKLPEMFFNDEGYFILRFHSVDDKDLVLMKGPYTIRNMAMLLRDWKPNFNLQRDMLRTIPIWVKLPHLPLYLWGKRSLSMIGSVLGTPLVTDECTANRLRVSYARILVEIDITQAPIDEITIKDSEGNRMKQPVEYEWRPKFCHRCQKVGHNCETRQPQGTKQWKPKEAKQPEQQEIVVKKTAETLPESEPTWTTVERSRKGKEIIKEGTTEILSHNTFESLNLLNEVVVIPDKT